MTVRLIKTIVLLGAVFGVAVIGNVFFGDLSAPVNEINETVTIDAK